jgi:acetyltransferase
MSGVRHSPDPFFNPQSGVVPDIQEVDMNPVLASLAIRPYPNQYTAPFKLRNGIEVTVRAISPEDENLIIALHAGHSEHTLRMRFFGLVKTLSHDSLIRLCHLDYDCEMALVAVRRDNEGDHILGVSRYYLNPETGEAEFALVVGDASQRQGLGRHLMERLIAVARERGVRKLVGQILAENTSMLRLMQSLNFTPPHAVEKGVVAVELTL